MVTISNEFLCMKWVPWCNDKFWELFCIGEIKGIQDLGIGCLVGLFPRLAWTGCGNTVMSIPFILRNNIKSSMVLWNWRNLVASCPLKGNIILSLAHWQGSSVEYSPYKVRTPKMTKTWAFGVIYVDYFCDYLFINRYRINKHLLIIILWLKMGNIM